MKRFVRALGFFGLLSAAWFLAANGDPAAAQSVTQSQSQMGTKSAPPPPRPSVANLQVYVLRGWLDVFSTGMDELTDKLNRRGIRASVHGHVEYFGLADSIASRYQSGSRENLVIIGHSLGANAAVEMAARLATHKVPVALVVTYDPTITEYVSANVTRLVNFYQSNNGWGQQVQRGPGFRGVLENLDLAKEPDLGHTGIDKSNKLHMQTIAFVQSLGGIRTAASQKTGYSVRRNNTVPIGTREGAMSRKRMPPLSSQAPASSTERMPRL